ncbi:DsrE family protein [Sediminivirga luteola]|jgi:intracellular sulfur oxidation DsrE/DsrF family protein|uniref:DsrE family protein n=1 Tax=Sediminivirga luteola TaxID=1774748 RepID=UPI001F561C21|nr:DsrE family protein [Sediminivirga luteola]MCI2266885.1 DsrE family protein [Sediminivirga luteola]
MHRTVVHLNEDDTQKIRTVLQNITNLYVALAPDLQVELVAHGPGIAVVTEPPGEKLTALLQTGLQMLVCQNTMTNRGLTPAHIHPAATIVPSGVAHLVTRQTQGWSYLHP